MAPKAKFDGEATPRGQLRLDFRDEMADRGEKRVIFNHGNSLDSTEQGRLDESYQRQSGVRKSVHGISRKKPFRASIVDLVLDDYKKDVSNIQGSLEMSRQKKDLILKKNGVRTFETKSNNFIRPN